MARVIISVPDDLLDRARSEGLIVSRVSAAALAEELDRRARIVLLDRYLNELDDASGSLSAKAGGRGRLGRARAGRRRRSRDGRSAAGGDRPDQ